MDDCDSDYNERDRFTPAVRSEEDLNILDEAAATPERTPSPDPCDEPSPTKKSSSIWTPLRRFICRDFSKRFSCSPTPFILPPCPIANPARRAPCACQSCKTPPQTFAMESSMDSSSSDEREEEPSPPVEVANFTKTNMREENSSKIGQQIPRVVRSAPPAPQLSGMCSFEARPAVAAPSCLRNSCYIVPRRRRRPRNARHGACDSKQSSCSLNFKPKLKVTRKRPRRPPRKRNTKQSMGNSARKKPPWMQNYTVDPDIWDFLKQYRRENAKDCLENVLNKSMYEYSKTSECVDSDNESDCSDVSEGTFRDAASIARSLSSASHRSAIPNIASSGGGGGGGLTFVRPLPQENVSRQCNVSCKSPTSVCSLSIRSNRRPSNKIVASGGRVNVSSYPEIFNTVKTVCDADSYSRRRRRPSDYSTPFQVNHESDKQERVRTKPNCCPQSGPLPSPPQPQSQNNFPANASCCSNVPRCSSPCGRNKDREAAAFHHFLKIFKCQNPNLNSDQALADAECAWSKLNPKYRRLYGGAFTPSHLSPSLSDEDNRGSAGVSCAAVSCGGGVAAGGSGSGGRPPPPSCPNGIGPTLVGVLTKKLVEACKDQLVAPEHRRLLRDLIGHEVTVKICNVKKCR